VWGGGGGGLETLRGVGWCGGVWGWVGGVVKEGGGWLRGWVGLSKGKVKAG
jgi:hypothetical protein